MGRHAGLRVDSAAHTVICLLIDVGGSWTKERLIAALPSRESNKTFLAKVTKPLEQCGYVTSDKFALKATELGRKYVETFRAQNEPHAAPYVGKVALPRGAAPRRPLDFARLYGTSLRRPGADDFGEYPSLMAGQRIAPTGRR